MITPNDMPSNSMQDNKDPRINGQIVSPGLDFDEIDLPTIEIPNQDEPLWERLLEQVVQGNIVPVICPDILVEGSDLHQWLVKASAHCLGLKTNPQTFSELVFDKEYMEKTKDKNYIYLLVEAILNKKNFEPSALLKEILDIRHFPFVITTTFSPLVEQYMRKVWGDELRVQCFSNNPKQNGNIKDEADMRKPTLYYMFGKAGAGRYVLTDNDMLEFCSSWITDTDKRPQTLVSLLKNKYLLVLGNNYSDWLFRFIWFSIRNSSNSEVMQCYTYEQEMDKGLEMFLERNHTFLQKDPSAFVAQLKERLAEKLRKEASTYYDKVEMNTDVFISYSRSDAAIAEAICNKLTEKGKRVWYDKKDISAGGDFMQEIKKGIQSARYFVPIISSNIEKERNDQHVYRVEWDYAIEVGRSLGRTFIIPVAEQGFDYYRSSLPEQLRLHNAITYSSLADMDAIVEQIIRTMNKN